jgi:predicted nucleotide-binding protein
MATHQENAELIARVFIGSSSKSLDIARQLKSVLIELAPRTAIIVWDEAFSPGQLLLQQIVHLVKEYDFGIFVFAADDVLQIQGRQTPNGKRYQQRVSGKSAEMTVRDNVLFEAGVFMGGLGHERTFIVIPRGLNMSLRTPTDLEGLLTANYRVKARNRNSVENHADIGSAANAIAESIRNLGPFPRSTYDELLALRQTIKKCEFKDGKKRLVVLEDVLQVAAQARTREWHPGVDPNDLMTPILDKWGDGVTDDSYWWFVVYGVFRFVNIDQFTSGKGWKWKHSIEFVRLSARGTALLNLLKKERKIRRRIKN